MGIAVALEAFRQQGVPVIEAAIERGIRESIVWRKTSRSDVQHRYLEDDPPMISKFFLWNITNVEEVRKGSKPKLKEAGPYTFYLHREKVNVDFSFNDEAVSFNEYLYFVYAPGMTNGSVTEDKITTLNLPLVGAIETIKAKAPKRLSVWLEYMAHLIEGWTDSHINGIFTTRSPMELLFGYEDPLLKTISRLVPGVHIDPRFALLINMTSPDVSEDMGYRHSVSTGVRNISDVLQFRSWRGLSEIDSWNPPYVEKIRGTDAVQFRPGLEYGDSVEVWIGELFRAGLLTEGVKVPPDWSNSTRNLFGVQNQFNSKQSSCKGRKEAGGRKGISTSTDCFSFKVLQNDASDENLPQIRNVFVGSVPVLRFRPDPSMRGRDPRYFQEIDGLMNVTSPIFNGNPGPRIFVSLPGYCAVDEKVPKSTDGVECDWIRHDLFIDVEPNTGITLRAHKALMFSSWFGESYSSVDKHIPDAYLPIFWAQQINEASPEQLGKFKLLLMGKKVLKIMHSSIAPFSAIGVVFFGIVIFSIGLVRTTTKSSDQQTNSRVPGDQDFNIEEPLLSAREEPDVTCRSGASEPENVEP